MSEEIRVIRKMIPGMGNSAPWHFVRVEKWSGGQLTWIAEKSYSKQASAKSFIRRMVKEMEGNK